MRCWGGGVILHGATPVYAGVDFGDFGDFGAFLAHSGQVA